MFHKCLFYQFVKKFRKEKHLLSGVKSLSLNIDIEVKNQILKSPSIILSRIRQIWKRPVPSIIVLSESFEMKSVKIKILISFVQSLSFFKTRVAPAANRTIVISSRKALKIKDFQSRDITSSSIWLYICLWLYMDYQNKKGRINWLMFFR